MSVFAHIYRRDDRKRLDPWDYQEPHAFPPLPCRTIKLTAELLKLDEVSRRSLEARTRLTWKAN